ncbi:hypothetical protein HMPREF9093_02132 [Fusobacterium sp. oral taxon 370 str. F0437]|nr:hypothetical protein HMPREF9093_02132 [Fusobacterium sp. oral taxon 370 str. F0437]
MIKMIKTVNVLDRNDEINKVIQVFERNKEFDFFYDKEKKEYFLRKNKKIYTGEYEQVKNYIDIDFSYENLNSFLHKERAFYKDGKKDGIVIYEFFKSNIRFEINYRNGKREGKYSIYRFSKKQNKIVRIYEEGLYADDKKVSFTQYDYNRKDELEIRSINYQKLEEILIFRDGTKIAKKVFKNLGKRDLFNFPISSSNTGLLEANQYKDDKLKAEACFSAGILKKIIHYDENEKISSIDYFDIYFNGEIEDFHETSNFKNRKNNFEDSLITKKDLKIYDEKNNKYINYPDRFIDGLADIKLQLKVLKDNIEANIDLGYLEDKLKTLPKYTEYFDEEGKIYKRDFYRIEKIINCWGTTLEAMLEESEYYVENSENIRTEKVNKRVYVDYDSKSKFIKIFSKE